MQAIAAALDDEAVRLERIAAMVRDHARLLRLGVVGVAELRPRAASAASGEPAADASPAASSLIVVSTRS